MKRSSRAIFNLILLFFIVITATHHKESYSNECGEMFDNILSPLCTDAKYIFWSGLIVSSALYITKDSASITITREIHKRNYLRNWGEIGHEVGYGVLNGLYVLANLADRSTKGNQNAEHMTESSLYALLITMATKSVVRQQRPGFPQYEDSFPSGHAAASMAFASVIHSRHGLAPGLLAYFFASYISYSRMNDNWHYLHDVIAGATLGLSYGWGVYYNHDQYKKPYWLSVTPLLGPSQRGLMATYRF